MEDKELRKAFNRYLFLISKYPVMVGMIKEFLTFKRFYQTIPDDHLDKYANQEANEDSIKEIFLDIISILEEIEENIAILERKQLYKIPVFNFNADLIIEHSRKIIQLDYQLSYLRMILNLYQNHLERRYQELQIHPSNYDPAFLKKVFSAFRYVNDSAIEEIGLTDLPGMTAPDTFEGKIIAELSSLIEMQSLNENTPSMILEAINNPPGTKRKHVTSDEEDESEKQQEQQKSEYLVKKEVQEILKISPTTVYNYTKKGLLKQYKIEHKNYYKRDEVMELLQGNNS